MLTVFLAAGLQSASDAWSPPAQGAWHGTASPGLDVRLSSPTETVAMDGTVPLTVTLSSSKDSIGVSPMINVTRGIAYEVSDFRGRIVAPKEPIAISPPAPPLGVDRLTMVKRGSPFVVAAGARAINLFPAPGRYRIRAVIYLMDVEGLPTRRADLRSNELVIDVISR